MSYNLNQFKQKKNGKSGTLKKVRELLKHTVDEKGRLQKAFLVMVINSVFSLVSPLMIGYTIDHYFEAGKYKGVLLFSGLLLGMHLISFITRYLQTILMGTVGQKVLFNMRNTLFSKLQELPVDFFYQNKSGDLISRLNNDTDKVNQFFSQSLMQFVTNLFMMIGSGIFLLTLNIQLGLATLAPAALLYLFTKIISPWVKRKNAQSLKSTGNLSADIQENLTNFKVIMAFNRRDYFRKKFNEANQQNYKAAVGAGIANNIFYPVYSLAANLGQLIVLIAGIYLITQGALTIGLLISFISYATSFYNPLRQLAMLWAGFQVALAAWDRISQILSLNTNILIQEENNRQHENAVLTFNDVYFSYPNGTEVLQKINLKLEKGKTYALVGPTGGGKTTTASLMARLYDPSKGSIFLNGKDISTYPHEERTNKVGFILQEPILFSGNVKENILYGNNNYLKYSNEELIAELEKAGLASLLQRFDKGLDTPVSLGGDGLSLGQRQIIAFMRAVLRKPEILILDEATANIDTVTEQLLEEILKNLPKSTTLVIIAHRLNTIENADEIYFVNSNRVTNAGSLENAVDMLLHGQKSS